MYHEPPPSLITDPRDERESYTAAMRQRQERFCTLPDVECVRLNNLACDAQLEANRWGRLASRLIDIRKGLLAELDPHYGPVTYSAAQKSLIRKAARAHERELGEAVRRQRIAQNKVNRYRVLLKRREG